MTVASLNLRTPTETVDAPRALSNDAPSTKEMMEEHKRMIVERMKTGARTAGLSRWWPVGARIRPEAGTSTVADVATLWHPINDAAAKPGRAARFPWTLVAC